MAVSHHVAILEGYRTPPPRKRRKRKRSFAGGTARQHSAFSRAARACKGKRLGAFRKCMASHLKKRRRKRR